MIVVIEANSSIHNVASTLLKNPFNNKKEILQFQHNAYLSLMNIEINGIESEITHINKLSSK